MSISSPRSRLCAFVASVLLVAPVAGCASSPSPGPEDAAPPAPAEPAASTTSVSTTTTEPPPTTTTEPPPPPPPVYRVGDEAAEVKILQDWLTALGYRPGTADGRYGPATASAVMAFQKHEGLSRDGVAGPQVLGAMAGGTRGAGPRHQGAGPALEVDLYRQIMFVTLADGSVRILNVSTGNNETYRHPAGYSAVAVTPTGSFAVSRKIDAEEHAPLGTLYRPMYFKGGYAVHGSRSVPAHPASHGCVRVSYEDEDWLFPQVPLGTPVVIYGGGTQPEANTDAPGA
jgi:peptidoglycan hydrolase-like protein with peptidoglycan-binding domain